MTYTMTFSPREHDVLEMIRRGESVTFNTLAQNFEDRIPQDELWLILDRFRDAGLIRLYDAPRSKVIILTIDGRKLLKELLRG